MDVLFRRSLRFLNLILHLILSVKRRGSSDMARSLVNLTSKTIVLTGYGGYDKLRVEERSVPKPDKGEVIVNIKASGINFAELMLRQGMYANGPKLPAVLGLEGSGVIVEVEENVSSLKVGQRVICMSNFGLWTEYAAVKADNCFIMPDSMSFEEGAAIPVNYITAHHMLFELGNLRKGKSVLIHMAAGGVGCAATQLCKTVDNVTIFGTSSTHKHDIIRSEGVTHPIDYRTQDYVAEIRKISPQGVDIVLDPLSGADGHKGWDLLKPFGKIIHFGAANMVSGPNRSLWAIVKTWWQTIRYNALYMISSNKCACGYHMGYLTDSPELIRSTMEELLDLYKQGKIKPKIDSVWSFEEVVKAMAQMHDRKNVGKVILSTEKKFEEKKEN